MGGTPLGVTSVFLADDTVELTLPRQFDRLGARGDDECVEGLGMTIGESDLPPPGVQGDRAMAEKDPDVEVIGKLLQ